MQNLDAQKKNVVLILLGSILAFIIWINFSDPLSINAQKSENTKIDQKFLDPSKDFKSLDNYLTYSIPENWAKNNQIDSEFGQKTNISLSSPEASSSGEVTIGLKIWISRKYDPKSEETLTAKLNADYPIYDYNIRAFSLGNKNAVTLHEDYAGHNRFIYIAGKEHLWTITISSNSLEEEQKYEPEINNFLNSIQFKD